MTTTRSDSGESIGQNPQIPEKTSISRDEFVEDSLKIVSLPPVEISPKKQVISSPSTSVSEKDREISHPDSIEVSSSETISLLSKEAEAMDVECTGFVVIPETGSTFLEEKQLISSPSEKDGEIIHSASSVEVSSSVKEPKAMDLECHGFVSVPETASISLGYEDVHKIEEVVDGDWSVVSISEIQGFEQESLKTSEKKGQDSDAQRLLEAEKRRLLAAIEAGTIFKKRVDVDTNGNGSKEQLEKMGTMRVKDNAFVGRSVNMELVDDTALLNVVPFYTKGKVHPKRPGTAHTEKDAPRKHKRIGQKPIGGKQASNVLEGNGNGKKLYSRKQMESMRYTHIANQKKLWSDMYANLLPELVTEYEGLVCLKSQKTSKSYPRDSGIGILGTEEGTDNVVEEDYTEENDDYNSILRPAFAVDGEPDFDSGPPEDGLEYLRRVRWEAKRIPNVKVVKIDESKYQKKEQSVYMPQIPEIPKCPEHLLPVKEWEDSLLSDFAQLRLALSQNGNECEDEIMLGQSVEDVLMEVFSKRLHTEIDESFGVVVSEIQGMDSVTRVSRLKKRICLVEKESGLESSDCRWVVALCASVDTPLDADTCACLRALLRKCASLRALEKVEDEQVIIMANMLITITGRYFGQME